jgi:hypothetical protein
MVIPVKIADKIYAIETPNNTNDVVVNIYFLGCSSVDVKKAWIK